MAIIRLDTDANMSVKVGKIGKGLIELSLPEGSTVQDAIEASGLPFDKTSDRVKLARDPDADEDTELEDGDRFYIVGQYAGGR